MTDPTPIELPAGSDPDDIKAATVAAVDAIADGLRDAIRIAVERERAGEPLPDAVWEQSTKAIAVAVAGPVRAVWAAAWTAALDTEPATQVKPARSTGGLVEQLLDLAGRLGKRNPEAYARHVPTDYVDEAKDLMEELESAAQELESWASDATGVLDDREAW